MASPVNTRFCPASANQKRMYVLNRLTPDGTEYNVPIALRLEGELDVGRLTQALSALTARHASLRTAFEIAGDEVVQKIEARVEIQLPCFEAKTNADIEEIRKCFVRPFDLNCAPLFRSGLIKLDRAEHVLLLDLHHIVCDGVSVDILCDELGRLYEGQELKAAGEYQDFAVWQKEFTTTAEASAQEKYWLDLLGDDRPALNFPTDFPRSRTQSFDGASVFKPLGPDLSSGLRALIAKNRVSMYMVLLAAYYVLLSKYSGQEDLIVGTLVSGRRDDRFRDVVGLFVNTLVLRSRPRGELEFVEYLKQVRGECLDAFENQDYQFENLVDRISPQRDLGRNPLFDTMFGALTSEQKVTCHRGVNFSRYDLEYEISKFDLSLTAIEQPDQETLLEFEYCAELFRRETIERLASHYLNVLEEVVANPGVRLAEINILTVEERRCVFTPREMDKAESQKSVRESFQAQVRRTPAATALSCEAVSLTYEELDRRSSNLAAKLRSQGVNRGDVVGVAATPSVEAIVALLGVLKLGAAYLPIDPGTPAERFRGIVTDSGIATLLVRGDSRPFALPGLAITQLDKDVGETRENLTPLPDIDSDDLAYVIYTSGSTGTPKGVMVSHGALANYINWATKTYIGESEESFALHSSLSVDLTVTSIFVPLVSGNRIVIYQNDDASELIREIVRENRVQIIKLTPTHLTLLGEAVRDVDASASTLRKIIVGGEDLKTVLAAKIHAAFGGRVQIFNEYGPTEATVGCTIHKYEPEADQALSVPIGTAIDNSRVFLLDRYGKPVPRGVTGELCVAGVCLADGYLNKTRLTAERFVVSGNGMAHVRMYKTGDLARTLPNGEIEFIGRNDDQVKIRGFRIELGEIEANLRRLIGVKDAVVTAGVDRAGDAYLCAYVVLLEGVLTADLRTQLAERLPEYMIPAWFVALDHLPIGRGGKFDKDALPDPREGLVSPSTYAAPRTTVEIAMTEIWQQVLGLQRVGIDENFFEIGGQSLKATLMVARVNRALRANISLRDVFAHPVVRDLAGIVGLQGQDLSTVIEPVDEREYYPVSSAQKRLYILHQLAPADVQYNVPWAIEITGTFDSLRWEQAFRALIGRHESLRTSFVLIDDEIVQKINPQVEFAFEFTSTIRGAPLQQQIERFVRPFDLSKAPLIRAAIVETTAYLHTVIVDMHHVVSDGISVEIILDELCSLYRGQTLEPLPIQYKDYAVWQRTYSTTTAVQVQGDYWKTLFEGELPVLNLPNDFNRSAVQSFEGDLVTFRVGPATVERLRAINRDCGATMHMILLAAYAILLSKYSGQEDVIVGTPVAGRNQASVQKIVGMFANVLAMRNQPAKELTFLQFLELVKRNALDAYHNQEYQFEELVDELKIERDLSRNPLFDTVFASMGERSKQMDIDGLGVKLIDFDWKVSKFDLTLLAAEREQTIDFELEYCTKLFRRSTIERLAGHFKHILDQIAREAGQKIADIDVLSEIEQRQILIDFNRTEHHYAEHQSIHELFEEQVSKTPGNVAVVCGQTSLSYLELNQRANQIARAIASRRVAREEVVGIIAEPSLEMIVGSLAILKAGCAYLPIDPDCPKDRARAMLEDSGARIVIEAGGAKWGDESRLVLDLGQAELYQGDDSNLGQEVRGRDLAYVIYTSGTTGTPKGVMIEHHSVNNLCAWHNSEFQVTAEDRATKYARFSFDASVWEIFPYLQAGAALHVIDEQIRLDLPRLNRYFEENGITISFLPTPVCELFLELDNKSLRTLLTGGDRLRRFRPKNYRVVNNYGPTENTVVATSCDVEIQEDRIPIGKPVFNTRVYLLGKSDKLVPIGVPGELCIAGCGLARAYMNDAERTAEKFVDDPFEPGSRMYRTGDLARWLPDGRIEFVGRTDKQIKVRGCRIEPREIEATILAFEGIEDAVVIARPDGQNNNFLCAYVVWRDAPALAELRSYLSQQLPDYMMPAFLVDTERIPINARGKVDLDALPKPDGSLAAGTSYLAARSEAEKRLTEIWSQVLERERIGVHENFFEIGGHSLRATIMLAKANKEFVADIALGAVFDNPTIASLAHCFASVSPHEATMVHPAEGRLHYSVTPIQKLLYALCMSRKGVEYNLPMAFDLHGDLNVVKLESVFRELIARHEAFRTSFRMVGERAVQTVSPTVEFAIDVREECKEDEIDDVVRDFIRPFDLAQAPLLRVALVPMGADRHVLMMDMHHLVSDGTSMGILFQEMAALYADEALPIPAITFKDFAEWLHDNLQTKKVCEQEKYWLSVLGEPPPVLKLDTDYPRPENFSFAGGRISFDAGPGVHRELKTLCAQYGVTLYMLLLAAYNVLLSKYSGREDIIVGVPTVGRYIADVQDVLGMFVNTHAVRSRPEADLRFDEFLVQVKNGVRGALEHQEYQLWDMMVAHAMKTGGKPLFNTVFVVQDQAFTTMAMPGLDVAEMDVGYDVSKFDLTLGAVERGDEIEFEVEYSTDLFRRNTAKRFARHYSNILDQIIADPGKRLSQIEVLTQAEKEKVLHEFNGGVAEDRGEPEDSTDRNVIEIFERRARESPDRVAAVCNGDSITYRDLNRRANKLARHLCRMGIGPGDIGGVMIGSSFEMLIGILAVMKAGAAYMPVSNNFPGKRIEHLLTNSNAKLLLCDAELNQSRFETTLVNVFDQKNYDPDDSNLDRIVDAGALAYVNYVADQTGAARGVKIEHRALLDRCQWYVKRFAVTPDDRSAKYGDLSASATIFELFPFLCAGASICILQEQIGCDIELLQYFEKNGVTISWLTAPICERLATTENTTLRVLISSARNVSAARRGTYEFVRCFGPAENTEIATCCSVHADGMSAVIGKPITNSQVYIIGHDGGLLPVGISGELCVAGAGLAAGYLGEDEPNSDKFTSNPHVPGGRMYRTGNLARWLPDGRVELKGHVDEVNIDGYRVSLREIERRLESYQSIEQAVVVFEDDDPLRQRLVAFIVTRGSLEVPPQAFVQDLKSHLAEWLPDYMIPDTYMKVAMVPRDEDGVVQYDLLPMPERGKSDTETTSPRSATATEISSIVEELLDMRPVGPEADLLDLGMNSLMAMSLVARLNGAFGVAPNVCQVLTTPTISGVAQSLSETLGNYTSSASMPPESRVS